MKNDLNFLRENNNKEKELNIIPLFKNDSNNNSFHKNEKPLFSKKEQTHTKNQSNYTDALTSNREFSIGTRDQNKSLKLLLDNGKILNNV